VPRGARWSCPSCRQVLGLVDKNGTLTVEAGGRVTVPAALSGGVVLIVICDHCQAPRRWAPRPPGFETKVG